MAEKKGVTSSMAGRAVTFLMILSTTLTMVKNAKNDNDNKPECCKLSTFVISSSDDINANTSNDDEEIMENQIKQSVFNIFESSLRRL